MQVSVLTVDRHTLDADESEIARRSNFPLVYKIQFSTQVQGVEKSWEVVQTLENVMNLFLDLKEKNIYDAEFGELNYNSSMIPADLLEYHLGQVIDQYGGNIWLDLQMLRFIKGQHKDSVVGAIQIEIMIDLIKKLRSELKSTQDDQSRASHDTKTRTAPSPVSGGNSTCAKSTSSSYFRREDDEISTYSHSRENSLTGFVSDPPLSSSNSRVETHSDEGYDRNRRGQYSTREYGRQNYGEQLPYSTVGHQLQLQQHQQQQQYQHQNQQQQYQPRPYTSQSYDVGNRNSSTPSEQSRYSQPRGPLFQPIASSLSELTLSQEQRDLYEHQCEQILQICGPHDDQIFYRSSVIALLQKNIRKALSSTALDISLQVLNCFLPDDPLKFSVILSKMINPATDYSAILENHFKQLADRSLRRSIHAGALNRTNGGPIDAVGPDGEFGVAKNHIIKNVKVTKHNVGIKLVCNIDDFIDVEVVFNNRNDLCMMTFIEEVALLVGRDNLFKRSLMLIRTWWFYETAAYMGSSIKHYLSDYSLCVMIIAIFNQFHQQISTPMDAMCIFLNQYADYDGHNSAITLQGIVPFHPGAHSNQPRLRLSGQDFLISNHILDKYSFMFRVGQQAQQGRSGDRDMNQMAINNVLLTTSTSFTGQYAKDSGDIYLVTMSRKSVDGYARPIFSNKIENFTRSTFNIVHPFTYSNMITVNLSHTRLTKLMRAFRVGKANLGKVLDATRDNINSAEGNLQSFYQVFLARFANDWRPDIVSPRLSFHGTRESPFAKVTIDNIWKNVLYCNMILDGLICESAIVTACTEEISTRCPRSVQELVQAIKDMIGQHSSVRLSGLKTILEKYPDTFAVVNGSNGIPLAFLWSRLSPEDTQLIRNGFCPPEHSSEPQVGSSPRSVGGPIQPRNANESRFFPRVNNFDEFSSISNSVASSPGNNSSTPQYGNSHFYNSEGMQFTSQNSMSANRVPQTTLSASAPAWPLTNNNSSGMNEPRGRAKQSLFSPVPSKQNVIRNLSGGNFDALDPSRSTEFNSSNLPLFDSSSSFGIPATHQVWPNSGNRTPLDPGYLDAGSNSSYFEDGGDYSPMARLSLSGGAGGSAAPADDANPYFQSITMTPRYGEVLDPFSPSSEALAKHSHETFRFRNQSKENPQYSQQPSQNLSQHPHQFPSP